MSLFDIFKKKKTVEPCYMPDPEYPEYPEYAIPISELRTGTYFYNFVIRGGERIPSDVYCIVGKWEPSSRIAAKPALFDTEDLMAFDSGMMVVPVSIDEVAESRDIHIDDLLIMTDCTSVYRVCAVLKDDKHRVLGFRLQNPSWNPFGQYYYTDVMTPDIGKYRKVSPISFVTIAKEE